MSNWTTITESMVQTRAAGPELEALKGAALPEGKTPAALLAEVIAQCVDKVRGYCATAVRFGHLSALGPSGTVPSRLENVTLNLIRFELATRLPGAGKRLIDEARMEAARRDDRLLMDVAAGKFAAEDPILEETKVTAPRPSISGRLPQFGRESQNGI